MASATDESRWLPASRAASLRRGGDLLELWPRRHRWGKVVKNRGGHVGGGEALLEQPLDEHHLPRKLASLEDSSDRLKNRV